MRPLSNAWTEEVKAQGGICIACPGLDDAAASVVTITPSAAQLRHHLAEYIDARLAVEPAVHAGGPAMHETERAFGLLYLDDGSQDAGVGAEETRDVELAEEVAYARDTATTAHQSRWAWDAGYSMTCAWVSLIISAGPWLSLHLMTIWSRTAGESN